MHITMPFVGPAPQKTDEPRTLGVVGQWSMPLRRHRPTPFNRCGLIQRPHQCLLYTLRICACRTQPVPCRPKGPGRIHSNVKIFLVGTGMAAYKPPSFHVGTDTSPFSLLQSGDQSQHLAYVGLGIVWNHCYPQRCRIFLSTAARLVSGSLLGRSAFGTHLSPLPGVHVQGI